MHAEITIQTGLLYGFLIVLARASGFLVLAPLPGLSAGPAATRVVLALALSVCLLPLAPTMGAQAQLGDLALWVAIQFGFGLVIGVGLSFLLEGFQIAAQTISLQAGLSYASIVDPLTDADTPVLETAVSLFAGLLFFALGMDAQFIKLLAIGLNAAPDAALLSKAFNTGAAMRLGSMMLNTGIRLALPVIGSLLLLDLAFALLSKVHSQMQLLHLSFSAKMLAGLALFALTLRFYPAAMERAATQTIETLLRLLH